MRQSSRNGRLQKPVKYLEDSRQQQQSQKQNPAVRFRQEEICLKEESY